jgi:hypothetical protein
MATPSTAPAVGGRAMVNVFDGTRQLYSDTPQLLITVTDGNQQRRSRDFHSTPNVFFTGLPLFDNFGDNYTFLASADGYQDTGYFPVKLSPNVDQIVDLMLLPKSNELNFANATWAALDNSRPTLKSRLANGAASDAEAANRYGSIMEDQQGQILACLLNITTAMQQISLPVGTPLDYVKRIIWDRDPNSPTHMAQDRFFAWADPALKDQVKQAKQQNPPEFADAPVTLHPGATSSYKQIQFGEANVQLTFHENDRLEVDGVNCVMLEPDIDYFKDTLNHLILEVLENFASGSLTDPKVVYVLHWIAGRRAGIPEFDPLYTIRKV